MTTPVRQSILAATVFSISIFPSGQNAPRVVEMPSVIGLAIDDTTGKGLPLTPTRPLRFTTDEGTWLSLDVSPDGRTILFDLVGDLYTLPITGGKATRITSGPGFDAQPRYSPDGRRIVFVSDRTGSDNVWIANADGSAPRQITATEWHRYISPEWIPDGGWIAVTRRTYPKRGDERNDLWLYPLEGQGGVQLTGKEPRATPPAAAAPLPVTYVGAAFGKDSRYVWTSATASPTGGWGKWQIYVFDRATGQSYPRSRALQSGLRPTLSPDGRWLVYATRHGAEGALRVRDLRTGAERWLVTKGQRDDQEGFWSLGGWSRDVAPGSSFTPDSRFLITSYGGKIMKVDVESGAPEVIAFTADVDQMIGPLALFPDTAESPTVRARMVMRPSPSPDGKRLVFSALNRLWLMDLPGGEPSRLTSERHGEHSPAWSPDGRWLAWLSWNDSLGGHVWKAPADGRGRPERLTTEPAYYDRLAWSPDGARLVAVRAPARERFDLVDELNRGQIVTLELVWLPAGGGEPTLIAPLRPSMRLAADYYGMPHFVGDPDRVWIHDPTDGLVSMRWDGTDRRLHVRARAWEFLGGEEMGASEIIAAPDGRRALALVNQNVYLVDLPPLGAEPLVVSFPSGAGASVPVRRLSRSGADFPAWSPDGRRAHWSLGASVFSQDVGSAETQPTAGAVPEPRRIDIKLSVPRAIPRGVVAFSGARIVTMRGDQVIQGGTIVVDGSRIVAVGRRGEVTIPAGARIIDVAGKTIIPGYVDIHAHMWAPWGVLREQPWEFQVNLAYGVTTSRDPQTMTPDVFAYSDLVATGGAVGPRIFATGRGIFPNEEIQSLDDARNVVRRYSEFWDAGTIKQYMVGDRKVRQWVVMAASEQKVSPTIEAGSDLKMNLTVMLDGYSGLEHSLKIWPLYKDVQELIRQSGITYTPTLISYSGGASMFEYFTQREPIENDAKLTRFVPQSKIESERLRRGVWVRDDQWPFPHVAREATAIARAGGRVGMGSHGNLQGRGVHWELWGFGMGGMKPIGIIRVATINGAQAIGLEREIGSLEPGKLADFQVLDRNPLDDIRNTDSIRWVVQGGRVFDGNTLAEQAPSERAGSSR